MLSVIVSFLYIGFTAFLSGFGVKLLIRRFLGYEIRETVGIVVAGLGAATVYAGFFSLLGPVGAAANIGLLIFCALVCFIGRKDLTAFWREKKKQLTPLKAGLLILLLLIMAYGTSRGYMHFDTGLYHAQSIRWIEEYGVVPGLVNLHSRLAYNSSAFVLTALYSGAFLTGQSLHTAAGFLALLLAVKGFSFKGLFVSGKMILSDFVRIALLWYLSIIYTEMMSPSSDYFAMLFLFYIVLTWLELTEKKEKDITPYSLLCVLLAVTITVKLSVAVMLLLVLKPAVVLLKEKQYTRIGIYLLLGIIAAFPWLARNVILSGWLIYPFDGLDLFQVDWKIPIGELQYDAEEIRVYAKGMTDVLLKDTPISGWFPGWFAALKGMEKIWVLTCAVSLAAGPLWCIWTWIKKKKEDYDLIFLEMVLAAGYLFWQLGSPLVRYGYLYILAFPFLTFGLFFVSLFGDGRLAYRIAAAAVVLLGMYKAVGLFHNMSLYSHMDCYLWQQDYYTGPYDSYQLGEITVYVPLESGQIGYDRFPSSPYVREDVVLRDTTIEGGFQRR